MKAQIKTACSAVSSQDVIQLKIENYRPGLMLCFILFDSRHL